MRWIDIYAKDDGEIRQIVHALSIYREEHPDAQIDVQRRNSFSIRIRIINPEFHGIDWVDREQNIWPILGPLPDEVFINITMLLLLTPEEAEESLANQEFENPLPSLV